VPRPRCLLTGPPFVLYLYRYAAGMAIFLVIVTGLRPATS